MKYAIGSAPWMLCFSVLLLGCGREEQLLAPEVPRLTSAVNPNSAVVTDARGDAVASDGSGVIGEAYQDIIGAQLSKKGRNFVFVMEVAGPLPAHPIRRRERILQEWSWNLNTDPSTFPPGFPFAPQSPAPPEFNVFVLWDGRTFRGILIDRRPLLVGQKVRITPIHFEIKRGTLRASVDRSPYWVTRRASCGSRAPTIGPRGWERATPRRWTELPTRIPSPGHSKPVSTPSAAVHLVPLRVPSPVERSQSLRLGTRSAAPRKRYRHPIWQSNLSSDGLQRDQTRWWLPALMAACRKPPTRFSSASSRSRATTASMSRAAVVRSRLQGRIPSAPNRCAPSASTWWTCTRYDA